MLELRRLQIIREVALQRSFSGAANELGFTPSAISQQVAQLERELGTRLVERHSTGVALTDAGRLLVEHANAILARASDAEEEIRQIVAGTTGRLRVAAFTTAAAALMPEAIISMRKTQPLVEIELVEKEGRDSVEHVRRGELDLALILRRGCAPPEAGDDGLERIPLVEDVIDVLMPIDHPLATQPSVSLLELADEPWSDCTFGRPIAHAMAAFGVEPTIVFTSDHHGVLQGVVAAGIALAPFPRLAQGNLRPDVVAKPIVPDAPSRLVLIAVRSDHRRSVTLATMITALQRAADRWMESFKQPALERDSAVTSEERPPLRLAAGSARSRPGGHRSR